MRLEFLIIDPQNDFLCDTRGRRCRCQARRRMPAVGGVAGSPRRPHRRPFTSPSIPTKLVDISHPIFWRDEKANRRRPSSQITVADVGKAVWAAVQAGHQPRALDYVRGLGATNGRYNPDLWPPALRGRQLGPTASFRWWPGRCGAGGNRLRPGWTT